MIWASGGKPGYNRNRVAPTSTVAATLTAPRGNVELRSVPVTEPGTGELLIRMEACGLCHSDLFVASPRKAAIVSAHLGARRNRPCGRNRSGGGRLVRRRSCGITFLASTCGACELCQTSRERFCPRQLNFGYTVHGALAAFAVVPAPLLFHVPDSLPAAEAAPLCCAGWTAFGALREPA